jgi:hypothetical protein
MARGLPDTSAMQPRGIAGYAISRLAVVCCVDCVRHVAYRVERRYKVGRSDTFGAVWRVSSLAGRRPV